MNDQIRNARCLPTALGRHCPKCDPEPEVVLHAVMYRNYILGTLCDSTEIGPWTTSPPFTMVTDKVTCPGCRLKIDGVPPAAGTTEGGYVSTTACPACPPSGDQALTEDEHRAIAMAGELMTLLRAIVGDGPHASQDLSEFAAPIHVIQRAVMKQAAARAYPDRYRLLGHALAPGVA